MIAGLQARHARILGFVFRHFRHFHGKALKQADLINATGKSFDWAKSGHAIIRINEWANWCVPRRMEMPAMAALKHRIGRNRLRIILFSQPRYWEADERLAKQLGLDFALMTAKNPKPEQLAAINLSMRADGFLLPAQSLLYADARASKR